MFLFFYFSFQISKKLGHVKPSSMAIINCECQQIATRGKPSTLVSTRTTRRVWRHAMCMTDTFWRTTCHAACTIHKNLQHHHRKLRDEGAKHSSQIDKSKSRQPRQRKQKNLSRVKFDPPDPTSNNKMETTRLVGISFGPYEAHTTRPNKQRCQKLVQNPKVRHCAISSCQPPGFHLRSCTDQHNSQNRNYMKLKMPSVKMHNFTQWPWIRTLHILNVISKSFPDPSISRQ